MKKLAFLLLCCSGYVTPSFAQHGESAFETISINLGSTHHVNHTRFNDYWNPGTGMELTIKTPFYLGYAEAGGVFQPFDGYAMNVPDFYSLGVFAGWGFRFDYLSPLAFLAGVRAGNNRMSFDYDAYYGERNESELTLALRSEIALRLFRNWSVYVAGTYSKTFTYIRLKPFYVTAGVTHTFNSPRWLVTLLR